MSHPSYRCVATTDPPWRREARACRACHECSPPLAYSGPEGEARPMLHVEGALDADLLFIAEAPNYDDTFDPAKGRLTVEPDTDPSGKFFHDCLVEHLHLRPDQVIVTNSVLCLPARSSSGAYPVKAAQRNRCSAHLRAVIEQVDPKVVVTLGAAALKAAKTIERHNLGLRSAVARPLSWFGRTLFALYHPSKLGRANRKADVQVQDYRTLRAMLDGLP